MLSSAPFWEMKPLATRLALGKTVGLGDEGFEAGDFGGVGSTLDLEVGGVQFGERWPFLTRSPAWVETAVTRPATSAPIFGSISASRVPSVSSVTSSAMLWALAMEISPAGRTVGGGTVGFAAAAGKTEGEDRARVARRMVEAFGLVTKADVRP